jgi:glycerol-3-phosphate dehydrogenase
MFVLPWGDRSYVGTTDTDDGAAPDGVRATEDDILYLLRSANAVFPDARLGPEDVSWTWAGLRPLLAGQPGRPSSRSREQVIEVGPRGLLTVAGGKLTTYRRMAIEVMNRIATLLRLPDQPIDPDQSASAREPLPGGGQRDPKDLFERGVWRRIPETAVAHLIGQYGTEAAAIYDLVEEWPELREPVHPHHGAVGAQVVHAVRQEYARRLDDVMARRLSLASETSDAGLAAAERVADLMGRELGWDEIRLRAEVERYRDLVNAIPRDGRLF